jgi:uncharacterized membrane protein YbhN (UPF0104 family)
LISDRTRKSIKLAIQALVSVCLVVFVLRQIDLTQAKSIVVQRHGWSWLLAALALFNLSKIASAVRLNVYQRHSAISLSEAENLRLYYAGMFLNLFLPGGIGGDGYKILVLHRRQAVPLKTLLTTTLADRMNGLLILLLLVCLMVPLLSLPSLPWTASTVQTVAALAGIMIAGVFIAAHRLLFNMDGSRVLTLFSYGAAVQLLQVACMAMLLSYLDVTADHYPAYLTVFLVSSLAAILPLSFGGLGAREVTFFYGMNMFQLDPTQGVVASSGFFLITAASSLVGALFLGQFSLKSPVASQGQ